MPERIFLKKIFFIFFRSGFQFLSIEGERVSKRPFRKEVAMRGKTRTLAYVQRAKKIDEELAVTLLAISVISKRMAMRLLAKTKKNGGM